MDENPPMGLQDPSAERFEALYATYHPQVFGYVLRRCGRPEDAADVIAETFLVAWRRLDDLPADDEIRPWLYGVARRVLSNQRRSAKRRSALTERLEAELAAQTMPLAVTHETANDRDFALREALAALSEEDREILTLEAWEDLSPAEIAVVLDCSPGAARTRLHRARRRLRGQLHATQSTTDLDETRNADKTGEKI